MKAKELVRGNTFSFTKRKNAKRGTVDHVEDIWPPRFSYKPHFGKLFIVLSDCKQIVCNPDAEVFIHAQVK